MDNKKVKHGIYKVWFNNGQISEQKKFNHGLLNGSFSFWNKSGILIRTGKYSNGSETGTWIDFFNNEKKPY